ncbi:MAG: glycogen-binding domain-containing protein [Gemmatimonadaceae bacterium]|nr:glycogen-binding domain-containing protein [Gemmatimonadaceae bacterium]
MSSSVDGGGAPITQRSDVWLGATQPLGRLGNVRFSAIGSGNVRARDAAGNGSAAEGMLALRARARFSGAQVWSAVSYGYADVHGDLTGGAVRSQPGFNVALDGSAVDTTLSSRVDIGNVSRAEAGVLSSLAGMEFSVGMSYERATRVTTQTLTLSEQELTLPSTMPMLGRQMTTRTTRSMQRREIATAIASLGFETGRATWLVSVTSPVATFITSDALAPKPRVSPTVASVAVVQPVTAWLSVVGAAATNTASVGTSALRDDVGAGRNRSFVPVVALGVRLARLPFFGNKDDAPSGILSFDTRVIGLVDAATVEGTAMVTRRDSTITAIIDSASDDLDMGSERDTLRIVLSIDAPKAESVELMGDATMWTVTPMRRGRDGRWRAALKLPPGVHRIAVRADGGKWIAPPSLPIGNDDYGTPVGMIIVKGAR